MSFRDPSALDDGGTLRLFTATRSDAGGFGAPPDSPHVDDVYLKFGRDGGLSLAELAERPARERWTLGEDWRVSSGTFTAETRVFASEEPNDTRKDTWRVHYERGRPLAIYCDSPSPEEPPNIAVALTRSRRFDISEGYERAAPSVQALQVMDDIVWADIGGRVVVERGEYVRFETPEGPTLFNEPLLHLRDNLYRVGGSGYVVAASRRVEVRDNRVECLHPTWWMAARERDAAKISRRVFTLKIYDGPYRYGARGTDIKLFDPVGLPSEADYALYSYDAEGLRGLYREKHEGVAAHKRALTISGADLLDRASRISGNLRLEAGRVAGEGTLEFRLPVKATKVLNFYWRGDEVGGRLKADDGPYARFSDYDGLSAGEVGLRLEVWNSLSSVRLEYEGLSDWEPYGRPRVDVLPAGWGGNLVKIVGRSGEGLLQRVGLPTGDYTASANIRCKRGRAMVGIGEAPGLELVSWNPLDKSIRGEGSFVAPRGLYDVLLTGEASGAAENAGVFEMEVDRFRIAPGTDGGWVSDDIAFRVETDNEERDISESVNLPNVPAGTPESRRFRVKVSAPEDLGEAEHVSIATLRAETYGTGSTTHERKVAYRAEGPSRLYYPESLVAVKRPEAAYYEIGGQGPSGQGPSGQGPSGGGGRVGVFRWDLRELRNPSDVALTIEGSPLAYRADEADGFAEGYFYLPVALDNGLWRVEVKEREVAVSLGSEVVGAVSGQGLPFRVASENAEDIRLETSAGLVQLRRGMGPRFEGFGLDWASVPATAARSFVVAFGRSEEEALSNVQFVGVEVRS